MQNIELVAPIVTLDNQLLLPAGSIFGPAAIQKIIAANRGTCKNVSLFKHGTVATDLRAFMTHPPYDTIFTNTPQADHLLEVMEKIWVIQPVLDSLDFFKANDFHTYRHMLMVYVLSCFFGRFLIPEFDKQIQDAVGGPTHDFGKLNVPLSILVKKEALTRSELAILRHHTLAGYCLLCHYHKDPGHVSAVIARDHHERSNGTGYPRGITKIPPMVEIAIASDVYDALLSPRSYRPKSFDNRSAVEVITAMAENQEIGWDIVKVLVSQNRADKPDFREVTVSLDKRGSSPEGNMYGIVVEDG